MAECIFNNRHNVRESCLPLESTQLTLDLSVAHTKCGNDIDISLSDNCNVLIESASHYCWFLSLGHVFAGGVKKTGI